MCVCVFTSGVENGLERFPCVICCSWYFSFLLFHVKMVISLSGKNIAYNVNDYVVPDECYLI